MSDLCISFIQSDIYWQDVYANLAMFEEKIWQINKPSDLIILPEMFNTGFSMNPKNFGENMNGRSMKWMQQMAQQTGAVITGSLIISEKREYYNRLLLMTPDGQCYGYDKRHLFSMAGEDELFSKGKQRVIINLKGWRICPMICYDLRFPLWSRNKRINTNDLEFDLLLYIANWPAVRIDVWVTLLKARAIENLCYTAGVNRLGVDGNNVEYNGHSNIIDFKGNPLCEWSNREETCYVKVNHEKLFEFRNKFPVHMDADSFELTDI